MTNYVRDGFSGVIQEASPDKGTWVLPVDCTPSVRHG
jgi:hypothetical protein